MFENGAFFLNKRDLQDDSAEGASNNISTERFQISLPKIEFSRQDLSDDDFLWYCTVCGIQFLVMIIMIAIYRSNYLNKITADRVEKELEREDKKQKLAAIKMGFTSKEKEIQEEIQHEQEMF